MADETARAEGRTDGSGEGRAESFAHVFEHHRARLRRMVELRLDPRLSGRVDPSDVLQEAYLDAADRFQEDRADPRVELYVWLRAQTWDRLVMIQRRHLGAARRTVDRELNASATLSSVVLARELAADQTSPSQGAVRAEMQARVREAVEGLNRDDREVIFMRHFEGMSNVEAAQALGLTQSGASMRYGRALLRLKELLTTGLGPGESEA